MNSEIVEVVINKNSATNLGGEDEWLSDESDKEENKNKGNAEDNADWESCDEEED